MYFRSSRYLHAHGWTIRHQSNYDAGNRLLWRKPMFQNFDSDDLQWCGKSLQPMCLMQLTMSMLLLSHSAALGSLQHCFANPASVKDFCLASALPKKARNSSSVLKFFLGQTLDRKSEWHNGRMLSETHLQSAQHEKTRCRLVPRLNSPITFTPAGTLAASKAFFCRKHFAGTPEACAQRPLVKCYAGVYNDSGWW